MKKLLGMIIVTIFLASLIPLNITLASPSPTPIYGLIEGISHPTPRDRPALESSSDLEGIDATSFYQFAVAVGAQPDTGNQWTVSVIDDFWGGFYYQDFECVLEGVHGNIWIGLNDTVWPGNTVADYFVDNPGFDDDEWHFMYPWSWNASGVIDPAYPDGYHDIIYGKNLTYVLDEFDKHMGIWETDTTFFGMYADRPGPLDDYKIQILIFNIRDGLFWDPETAPWFIEGYFWSYASELNDANIFHMDTWQWYRRLGPDPQPSPTGGAPRPYEYEGTFAHEFQHLIHYDVDSDEMSWVNEGCSTLAEYICGYGFSPGHISEYLIYWWDTSLVIWQGQLSNYGAVFLWTFYMYEHYGGAPLIWDIVHEEANGIEGYNNVLLAHGFEKTFDEIFQDWAIANYLDDTSFADGIYGYYALDIPSADTEWWDIPYTMWLWEQLYPDLFDTIVDKLKGYPQVGWPYPYGVSLPYTVNYVEFSARGAYALKIDFDGDDYVGIIPHSGVYEWHSDGTAWSWFRLGQTFDLTGVTEATLKFWSYYEIETDYDYGYVEVYDVDAEEWYTLPGTMTVSTIPNPQDNPNCPDDVEPTAYLAAERWNAFTGFSGVWYQEEMDLTPFAGHTIELYFTYWTDPYTLELGWYVDDIEIPEIDFFDNVESGAGDWTYTGWYITTGILENDFEVNFIQHVKATFPREEPFEFTYVKHMNLDDETEEGSVLIPMINNRLVQFGSAVMVIAAQPGFEHTFSTSYLFYYQKEPMPILW